MTQLADQECQACNAGAPALTGDALANARRELPEWDLLAEEEPKFARQFSLSNFEQALSFANRVGELAEQHNHHPKLIVEWGKVTVHWWTHKIKNVHHTDAVLAAKTDQIFRDYD
ncbi:MAG TPA: 4a-hydroxytetrahydrobiopterin dehydratase [Marinagarivorans sp.]